MQRSHSGVCDVHCQQAFATRLDCSFLIATFRTAPLSAIFKRESCFFQTWAFLSNGSAADCLRHLRCENSPYHDRFCAASKFRFAGGTCTKEGKATLKIGLSDMKGFKTTNLGTGADALAHKGKEQGAPRKYMADPLDATIIVESTDGFVPLLKRPAHATHAPGQVDTPSGAPEPSASGIPLSSVVVVGGPAKARRPGQRSSVDASSIGPEIVQSLFDSALTEVTEELNLPTDLVVSQKFLGVVRGAKTEGMLTAVFWVKFKGTLTDFTKRYEMGSKDGQSSELILAPVSQLSALNTTEPGVVVSGCRSVAAPRADGTKESVPTTSGSAEEDGQADVDCDDMAPSAKAALELWRMHKQKLAARRRSTAGFL